MELPTLSSVVLTLLCCLAYYHWSRRKLYLLASQVSGAFALPIFGNGLNFLCKREDFLNSLNSILSPYPSPVRIWLGPQLCIVVKDAEQLQIIMNSSKIVEKDFPYKFISPLLGKGLLTSSGADSKSHRKIIQPFFSQKNIDALIDIFQKHANDLVKELAPVVDGPEFDMASFTQLATLGSTMDVLLDKEGSDKFNLEEILGRIKSFYEIFVNRYNNFWLHPDFVFKLTSGYKEQSAIKEFVDSMFNVIYEGKAPEMMEKLKRLNRGEEILDEGAPSLLRLFVETYLENPNLLSTQDCLDHLLTFVVTSQDSQSSTIAFACMMIGAYPEVQRKVFQELKEVVGSRTVPDFTDVSRLKYLEMVLKETLRLFPVGPFIMRQTTEDFQLQHLTLPKGIPVVLSIYHVHRDPTHWERPNEFYPEHFTPEAIAKRHPFAFVPYSAGPRRCPAKDYAYVNMKILLGTLLLSYKIECRKKAEDIKLTMDLLSRPVGGHIIKLKKRNFINK